MNFSGLDIDALIALGFVGMLLAITAALFIFLLAPRYSEWVAP